MSERKKIMVRATTVDLEYLSLEQAVEKLMKLKDQYEGIKNTLEYGTEMYSDNKYLYICAERYETDQEMNKRLSQEEESRKWKEEHDRKEFERLKKKYEGSERT